jgi:hypothetical protein
MERMGLRQGQRAEAGPNSRSTVIAVAPAGVGTPGRPASQFGLSACAVQLDTVELELGRGARHCQFA